MSYAINYADLWRRAARYVDKILQGMKQGDLPVEQPTRFELTVNLKTARAIALELPTTLLAPCSRVTSFEVQSALDIEHSFEAQGKEARLESLTKRFLGGVSQVFMPQ